jgi:pantetheine-phosphate adenylyltransferase
MRTAVYAGSFDILTFGHLFVIQKGVNLFDNLIVAIGVNSQKKTLFTVEERKAMLDETCKEYSLLVDTDVFTDDYLVNYCVSKQADFYLRGLRDDNDFRFEMSMSEINRDIHFAVSPVWIPTDSHFKNISSSTVKALIGPPNWTELLKRYVPNPVLRKLKEKFDV